MKIGPAFHWPKHAIAVFAAALVLGLSFWVISYETVQVDSSRCGRNRRGNRLVLRHQAAAKLPLGFTLLTMLKAKTAFFEEWFFRGYLFPALHTKTTTATAIVVSAIAFGLFHDQSHTARVAELVISTTLVGPLLGWVRWRTGSVLPGMVLHGVNNALVLVPVFYEKQLADLGIGTLHTEHLPLAWIAGGAVAVCVGALVLFLSTNPAHECGRVRA